MLCKICGIEISRLASHVTSHQITYEEYSIKFDYSGIRPTCKCGCSGQVTFKKGKFKSFMHSHASRDQLIRNNMIEAGKKAAADPEKRKKNSDAVKKKWKDDPSYSKRIHSIENIEKRIKASSNATQTPEFCEKMKKLKKDLWDNKEWAARQRLLFSSKEFSDKVAKATTDALSTPERKQAMSDAAKDAYAQGRKKPKSNWSNIKSGYRPNPFLEYENIWFDSEWEYEFMKLCFHYHISCKREPFIIPYKRSDEKSASYFPDFLVNGNTVVEIKGQESPDDELKYQAGHVYAFKNHMHYVILKKKDFELFLEKINNGK